MGFTYTLDQQKVIDTTGCHVLVSAAAGSGKTAVLVERIIKMISNSEKLISIEQLLIVTFTHAAASEMRERISAGIEDAIEKSENELITIHLIKQLTLLSAANIMTLHGFCLKLLKSYYHIIDLDPGFRIGNETELVLIKEDVVDNLFEKEYEKGSAAFLRVVESFAPSKNDNPLKDLIFKIYRFAMSHPWPDQWFDESVLKLQINSVEEYVSSVYFQILVESVKTKLHVVKDSFYQLDELMVEESGPDKYMDTAGALYELYESMTTHIENEDYVELQNVYNNQSIPQLSRKTKGYDKELANEAKDIINSIKKKFESVESLFFDTSTILSEIQIIRENITELVRLTRLFKLAFMEGKENKNLIDFNDIEHLALKLLYVQGEVSSIGLGLRKEFVEVLVDEYQDTNEVQEAILLSVSKQDEINNNLFMVGDLKQSIYKFRLAKPEIFRDKYDVFTYDESNQIKIDLAVNFRSRKSVVDFSNNIFEKLMSKSIGDVEYNDVTKLYYGASYYDQTDSDMFIPELIFIEKGESKDSKPKLQGQVLATKIKQLVLDKELEVYDKDIGSLRSLEYSDICILMRSPASTINEIKDVFDNEEIPYLSDVSSGYFDAIEVQIILNLLRIIDNPYQDIPLVSVLRSALVHLDEIELSKIRTYAKEGCYYEALLAYIEDNEEDMKVRKFLTTLHELKEKSMLIPLHELIQTIYLQTGYPFFVQFMENGEQRKINLEYLESQAKTFEQSSYKGLFNFIRYIEHIKKYDIEIPEPMSGSGTSAVTLMSIHKSKGLEFPVVFLIDIHKQFNLMDLRKNFVLHQELGLGCDFIDPEKRLYNESGFSKAIKLKSKQELLSEELRLLYVALTRAKEKIYVVSVIDDYEGKIKPVQENFMKHINQVPPYFVEEAKSYLDLFLMSCPETSPLYNVSIIESVQEDEENIKSDYIYDELKGAKLDLFNKEINQEMYVGEDKDEFDKMFNPYAHEEQSGKYITLSVSELKNGETKSALMESQYEDSLMIKGIKKKPLPKFIQQTDKTLKGAAYGLVMHKVLSLLEPKENYTFNEIQTFVDELIQKGIIEQEYKDKIYIKPIVDFTKQPIYKRIITSHIDNKCFREQPFVLGIKEDDDIRMIQGVIDLYFEENNQLILLDYKTDYLKDGQEETLRSRYKVQLDYYKKALEDITRKEVSKSYIYSLSLGKLILMES